MDNVNMLNEYSSFTVYCCIMLTCSKSIWKIINFKGNKRRNNGYLWIQPDLSVSVYTGWKFLHSDTFKHPKLTCPSELFWMDHVFVQGYFTYNNLECVHFSPKNIPTKVLHIMTFYKSGPSCDISNFIKMV